MQLALQRLHHEEKIESKKNHQDGQGPALPIARHTSDMLQTANTDAIFTLANGRWSESSCSSNI